MALTPSGLFLKICFPGIEVGLVLCFSHENQAFSLKERAQTSGCLGLVLSQSSRVTLHKAFHFSKLQSLNRKPCTEHF